MKTIEELIEILQKKNLWLSKTIKGLFSLILVGQTRYILFHSTPLLGIDPMEAVKATFC
jgi:hypothetical protein